MTGPDGRGDAAEDVPTLIGAVAPEPVENEASRSFVTNELTEAGSQSLVASVALQSEHAIRARAASGWSVLLAAIGAIALQVAPDKPTIHWVATGVLVLTAVTAGYGWFSTRGKTVIDLRPILAVGVVGIIAVLTAIAYLGVLTPVVTVLPLIIYFWGLGDNPTHGWIAYLGCAAGHLVLMVLAVLGPLAPHDAVIALARDHNQLRPVIALGVFLQFVFAMSFWLARTSRQATIAAMDQLEQARRQVSDREALLNEARAEFNAVVEAGKIGRFTDRVVDGYRVGDIIGRGAMGEVYAAEGDGQRVALKVLHPHLFGEKQHVERFFREAEIALKLRSPNIVTVYGSGNSADGSPYLVMELLRGKDLAQHLRGRKRFTLSRTVDLVSDLADGLTVAQKAGVVHRDLKPQNVFLAESDDGTTRWKILDFGVSKLGGAASNLTRGIAVGTPGYMCPEQVRSESVDHRADVFSLGAIAYRAITGRPAFTAADEASTLYNVLSVQPLRPGELVEVESDVDGVIAMAIAKKASQRFESAKTFAAALRDAAEGRLDAGLRRRAEALTLHAPWGADQMKAASERQERVTDRPPARGANAASRTPG